ncbi:MAG: hypothetical protein AAF710_06470 [Planctomycetota bacterium]
MATPVHPAASARLEDIPPDARVARALATLPGYARWTHQPTRPEVEDALLDLDEQQLMTTAAACLLRLTRLQQGHGNDAG